MAEDNPDDISWARYAFLRSRIFNPVQVVRDGQEAMAYLAGDGVYCDRTAYPVPIFLLLDLAMPRKSGFEVLEWLKTRPAYQTLPVIVLTGMTDLSLVTRAYQLGALTFLLKPLRAEEMTLRFPRLKGFRFVVSGAGERYVEVD